MDSIADIEQTVREVSHLSQSLERQVVTRFDGRDLAGGDLAGISARNGKFQCSSLRGANFADVALTDVRFRDTDVRRTLFEHCTFGGVDFSDSDRRGLDLDGATFTRGRFDGTALAGATFRGATLRDVSFRTRLRKVVFDGARLDQLTYTGLQGLGTDLSHVRVGRR